MLELDEEQDELIQEFLVECNEGLDKLDQELVSLEEDPKNTEVLSGIFRTFHTIKGTAGFLAFQKLESVAHAGENLLSKLRDGILELNTGRTDALLKTVDVLRAILESIETERVEGNEDCTELLDNLIRLQEPEQDGYLSSGAAPTTSPEDSTTAAAQASGDTPPPAEIDDEAPTQPPNVSEPAIAEVEVSAGLTGEEQAPTALANEPTSVESSGSTANKRDSTTPAARRPNKPNVIDSSIRVDVHLLDSIMNLVGELVLTRNQIMQHTAGDPTSAMTATSQRLNLITSDLQEGVMKTRMQPIRNVWNKFPRVVRDLTSTCGKRAKLEMEGEDTELDRTILEAIKDPLTHMVRNSVDHGIESVEERLADGKPAEGTLRLRAYHEGGQVNLELADDGHGIDVERVKEKAVERGLLTQERASKLGEREALQLVFLPGFSTAAKVTNVSGRGVGMDVVRTNIEKIGGTVDIQSVRGGGTTLRIKIPLTLAIIPALLVTVDGCRFAIPQVSLIELVRIEGERAQEAIENVHGAPVYRLRGDLLPLADLRSELCLSPGADPEDGDERSLNIVVLQADDRQYGLVVDAVNDTEEIVVKPLSKQIRDLSLYAGATILGDGRVALILDSFGIAKRAGILAEAHDRSEADVTDSETTQAGDIETLLLLDLDEKCAAIPLSSVSRLEEIRLDQIERSGGYFVTQYRDMIMPLVWLGKSKEAIDQPDGEDTRLQVVVHAIGDQCVGLVVERIYDIVDTKIVLETTTRRTDTLGSAVVQGRVTDLFDVSGIVSRAIPSLVLPDTTSSEVQPS